MKNSLSGNMINWKGWTLRSGGYTFCPQYQAVYDTYGGVSGSVPQDDVCIQQDIMVRALLLSGVWQKLDCFYMMANDSAGNSRVNWINPGTYDLIPVNLVAGDFTAYRGWTGNGVNGYLRTQYNPAVNAINYAQNSASLSVYCGTDTNVGIDGGVYDGVNYTMIHSRNAGNYRAWFNAGAAGAVGAAFANSLGMSIGTRRGVNNQEVYRNAVSLLLNGSASAGIPNGEIYCLAFNNNGAAAIFTARTTSNFAIGGGLDEAGNAEVTNFTNAVNTYMTYIGANTF